MNTSEYYHPHQTIKFKSILYSRRIGRASLQILTKEVLHMKYFRFSEKILSYKMIEEVVSIMNL